MPLNCPRVFRGCRDGPYSVLFVVESCGDLIFCYVSLQFAVTSALVPSWNVVGARPWVLALAAIAFGLICPTTTSQVCRSLHMPMYSLLALFWMMFSSTAAMSGKVSVPGRTLGPQQVHFSLSWAVHSGRLCFGLRRFV